METIRRGLRWGVLFALALEAVTSLLLLAGAVANGALWDVTPVQASGVLGLAVLASLAFSAVARGHLTLARIAAALFAGTQLWVQMTLSDLGGTAPYRGGAFVVLAALVPLGILTLGPDRRERRTVPLVSTGLLAGIGTLAMGVFVVAAIVPDVAHRLTGSVQLLVFLGALIAGFAALGRRPELMVGVAVGFLPMMLIRVFAMWALNAMDGTSGVVALPGAVTVIGPPSAQWVPLVAWLIAVAAASIGLTHRRSVEA